MDQGIDICESFCDYLNLTVCTEEKYFECHRQILENEYLIPVSVLLIVILFSGITGNMCVCMVIVRHAGMRTATNCYLFSLAVSDLLILLFGLPQELWFYWHEFPDVLGTFMCQLRTFISESTTYASVLTVVAFSLERYIAICHPLHMCTSGLKRAIIVIIGIWLVSLACAVPQTLVVDVIGRFPYPPGSGNLSSCSTVCGLPMNISGSLEYFISSTSVMFFFIPMVVLVVVYAKIGLCIRSRHKLSTLYGDQGRIHSDGTQNKSAIKVLATVVIIFFICWAPFHYQRIYTPQLAARAQVIVYIVTGVLYYFSAAINPILYNVMSRRYRLAFKEVFLGLKRESSATQMYKMNGAQLMRSLTKESTTKSSIVRPDT